jgi:hypothetical protein
MPAIVSVNVLLTRAHDRMPWTCIDTVDAIELAMIGIEIVVALTVIGIVLFGSQERAERAFRLLRWIANRAPRARGLRGREHLVRLAPVTEAAGCRCPSCRPGC